MEEYAQEKIDYEGKIMSLEDTVEKLTMQLMGAMSSGNDQAHQRKTQQA